MRINRAAFTARALLLSMTALAACAPAAPNSASSSTRCEPTSGVIGTFIKIPSGSFVKGEHPVYPEERPSLKLHVTGFEIQAHEVTNAQFSEFTHATGYITDAELSYKARAPGAGSAVFIHPEERRAGQNAWQLVETANWRTPGLTSSSSEGLDNHPVVHITKRDAEAYAEWAGGRLPTEIEWEYAAQLGLPDPADPASGAYDDDRPRANTWQGIFPFDNSARDGFEDTSPAGCFGSDSAGLYDMIGNVWEWTDTPYGPGTHTVKGGSFLCADNFCKRYRPAARHPQESDFSSSHIGFRIIRDTNQDEAD